eukprot:ANDGO_02118.mRNA.1 hypothetical protein
MTRSTLFSRHMDKEVHLPVHDTELFVNMCVMCCWIAEHAKLAVGYRLDMAARLVSSSELIYGKEHRSTVSAKSYLAEILLKHQHYLPALELFSEVAASRLLFPKDSPLFISSQTNLALSFYLLGCVEEAMDEICVVPVPDYQSEPELACHHLHLRALLFEVSGSHMRALEHIRQSCQVLRVFSSFDSLSGAHVLFTASRIFGSLGMLEDAFRCLIRSLGVFEKSLGHSHPYTGLAYLSLGKLYIKFKEFAKACVLLAAARDILSAAGEPYDIHNADARRDLADCCSKLSFMDEEYLVDELVIEPTFS